jgi:AcrR family transcriptional regulator
MKPENQEARRKQIEAVAYELLTENGYRATSMLSIAKRASASNETLYKWYGNKQTLFRSLVESNAREVTDLLQQNIDRGSGIGQTIDRLGPMLLRMVTGEKAIALNRAAVADADETGILGATLSQAGRANVAPMIAKTFELARMRGELRFDDLHEAVEIYLSLLIGDLQIRRAIGACPQLTEPEIEQRAGRAWRVFHTLYGL